MLQPRPLDHVITAILEAELTECRKLVIILLLNFTSNGYFLVVMEV